LLKMFNTIQVRRSVLVTLCWQCLERESERERERERERETETETKNNF
jgi:hypothetical protein